MVAEKSGKAMSAYEYKVIPSPQRAAKVRGVKTPEGRFARTVEDVMNEMAREGWEFQRAELLPSEERSGLTGSTTTWRNLLVFRRARADAIDPGLTAEAEAPRAPVVAAPVPPAESGHAQVSNVADIGPALRVRSPRAETDDTPARRDPED
jgi:hypothetical protein